MPIYIGKITDSLTKTSLDESSNLLTTMSFYLFFIFIIQTISIFVRSYVFGIAGERLTNKLRLKLFSSIVFQEISFFDKTEMGEILNRISYDTKILENVITYTFATLFSKILEISIGVILMLTISRKLSFMMLMLTPFALLILYIFGGWYSKTSKKYSDSIAKPANVANETLSNIRTVRSFGQEERQIKMYQNLLKDSFEIGKTLHFTSGLSGSLMIATGNIVINVLLWYGGHLVLNNAISMGNLTSYIVYSFSVAKSFEGLSNLYFETVKSFGATERIYSLIFKKPEINVKRKGEILKDFKGNIEFKNVDFSYPTRPNQLILDNFSLSLEPGNVYALVGFSGGGKSTISRLIQHFYNRDNGEILIDNVKIEDLNYDWYREKFASVDQEPCLFGYSIEDNISFGSKYPISRTKIIEVAKLANAHEFISELEFGYDTKIGERGIQLSGGQKQRIAIARALLKNPSILILDEFSSALDSESEFLVQQALDRLVKGRTTLIIAHRLATIKNANKIFVIERGRIVESGDHEELLNRKGKYKKLHDRQMLD
eukprot:gene5374-9181_t